MFKHRFMLSAVLAAVLAASASASTVKLTDANYQKHADCKCDITSGGTDLVALSCSLPTTDKDGGIAKALKDQFGSWGGTAMECTWSTKQLANDIDVDWYKATDTPKGSQCRHGAQIVIRYLRGEGDPTNLGWIQVLTKNDGGLEVDPQQGAGSPPGDNKPFYFNYNDDGTLAENPYDYYKELGYGSPLAGTVLADAPGRYHFEAQSWSGGRKFQTFLGGWETDFHKLTLYNVVSWGYQGVCVPLPGALPAGTALMIVLAVVARIRSRMRARRP